MKKIYLLTIIYVIGLFLLLLTGLCEANWVFYIALSLSVIVNIGSILIERQNNV